MKKKNSIIFFVCYLAYTAIYIARLNLSIASPELISSNVLDMSQIGILGSVFSIVFAIGRIINGYITDKKSPCFMIATGLVVVSISNVIIGLAPSFISMVLLWSCNAYAQSMLWGALLCVIASIYDESESKKKGSILITSVAMGNIIGILFNTMLVNTFGMNYAFVIPGLITLVCGFLIIVFTRKLEGVKKDDAQKHISFVKLFANKKLKKVLIPAMCHGVMKDNISLWMTVYFVDTFKINLTESAWFVLFIPIVGFFGRISYLWLYRMSGYKENKLTGYAFVACAVLSVILCISGISPFVAIACLSLIYAAVSIANTSLLSIFPLRFADSGNVASVSGVLDCVSYGGAGIGSVLYGVLIEKFGYFPMFLSWAIISLISIVILHKYLMPKYKQS